MKTKFTARVFLAFIAICTAVILNGQALSNKEVGSRSGEQHAVEAPIWRIPTQLFSSKTSAGATPTASITFTGSSGRRAPVLPSPREPRVLMLQVTDIHKKPMSALQLNVENGPVSAPTDIRGIAKIPLSGGTKPGDLVKLYLLTPANGLVFISPWDQEVIVPSHSSTLLSVVIASQGDPALLKNSTALTALTENVLKRMQPRKNSEPVSAWQRESLARVSRIYGF